MENNKTKTFITVIPFQPKGETLEKDKLRPVIYEPAGNSKLAYGETRFPIIPTINGYCGEGDSIRVIAILIDGENYKYNYETYFVPEVNNLVENKKLKFSGIEIIRKADKEDIDTQLKLFTDIINMANDNEELFACLTYGRKLEPIVETLALNYAYKLKSNVSIGCIVYGLFHHTDSGSGTYIYDTTALFYMNSIVYKLAELKVSDPEAAIKSMLGIGDEINE